MNSPGQVFVLAESNKAIYIAGAMAQANLTYPTNCPPQTAEAPILKVNQPCGPDVVDRLVVQLFAALFPATSPLGLGVLPKGATHDAINEVAALEEAVTTAFWQSKIPLVLLWTLELAIITSDALAIIDIKGKDPRKWVGRSYTIRDYTKVLDKAGRLVTAITRDYLSTEEAAAGTPGAVIDDTGSVRKYVKHIYEYTRYRRDGEKWYLSVSLSNEDWDGKEELIEYCPVLHLEWKRNHAGSYGVGGPISQVVPDLMQLGQLYQALNNQLNGTNKALVGVSQTATATTAADVKSAETGSTIAAEPGSIFPVMMYDPKAIQILSQEINNKTQLIEKILGIPSVVREGERVTATEVEMVTQAKVGKYAGFYLVAEEALVRPIVDRIFKEMKAKLEVRATSGYATSQQLPRAQAITGWIQTMTAAEQDQSPLFKETLDRGRFGAMLAHAMNLNLATVYKTEDELKQQAQQEQEQKIQDAALEQAKNQPLAPAGAPPMPPSGYPQG